MRVFRRAYSVVAALLMLQFLAQLYFIAGAIFTIVNANDNAKDVYSAFKNSDSFAGLHAINGDLIGLTTLVMFGLALASRFPRRTIILTGLLFVLLLVQVVLAHTGIPVVSALHGLNAVVMIGLGGYLTGRAFRPEAEVVATAP